MIDGFFILIAIIIAAVCGAIWGLWQGEKSNAELRKKNTTLFRELEAEKEANQALRKWLNFYKENLNVRN